MPMGSTPEEFAEAVRRRQSRVTLALDDLFASPSDLREHPNIGELDDSGFFNGPIPNWVLAELRARGVRKQREIDHINNWPKTGLREAMAHAIENGVRMRFYWELSDEASEETNVIVPEPLPTAGVISITFVSPASRVRFEGGEILTDVLETSS